MRVPTAEGHRLDALVAQAMKDGSENYGTYFRLRCRDGTLRWTRTQGYIRRDETGRPRRIIGIVRDATQEVGDIEARREQAAQDEARRRPTNVVQLATAALAHARTVDDVIEVLAGHPRPHPPGRHQPRDGSGRGRPHPAGRRRPRQQLRPGHPRHPDRRAVPDERGRTDPQSPLHRVAGGVRGALPLLWQSITHLNITAAAYLPLIAQARPIGAIGLLYSDRRGFSAEDRNVLVALGSGIAQSLQRAMLYEQEMDLAEGLQQAMLPRSIPSVPGCDVAVRYRAATIGGSLGRDIGGDWYDLIPLPGGRVGAVIGDVQGHDTHAAAVMGPAAHRAARLRRRGPPPATVMARASVFLHELDTDRFATCLYAEADLGTGVVQVVRAGHIDPLLRRDDRTCRRVPVEGGLPLGLSAEFGRLAYPVSTVELDPGNTLLLCTDGLVEQPGADLDEGIEVLTALVASGPQDVRDLADRLIDVAEERGGDDDVALLLLRRHGVNTPGPSAGSSSTCPGRPRGPNRGPAHDPRRRPRLGAPRPERQIELVADELVTNALAHTEGSAVVTLRLLTGTDRRLPGRGRGLLQRPAAPPRRRGRRCLRARAAPGRDPRRRVGAW
ncbi:SpoIIE family protein phosphatase [Streptomyces thinghirensis]|nr:SpoIIE family protein phosphatase [Streptomyces thinghirensis]